MQIFQFKDIWIGQSKCVYQINISFSITLKTRKSFGMLGS